MSRTLIYVPIVHDGFSDYDWKKEEDFMSSPAVITYLEELCSFWNDVEEELKDRKIDRIYQDSFCGREEEYQKYIENRIEDRNSNLVLTLEEKGSKLMPTENLSLLIDFDYCLLFDDEYFDSILFQRDVYVVNNLNKTLLEGETGILFVGIGHKWIEDLFEALYPEIKLESREKPEKLAVIGEVVANKYYLWYDDN